MKTPEGKSVREDISGRMTARRRLMIMLPLLFLFLIAGCGVKKELTVKIMEIKDGWQFKKKGDDTWYKAVVPGCVHTDLMACGLLENPFYRNNESKAQWVEQKEWEYRTRFMVDNEFLQKKNIELIFKGLDTYAKVYLNGTLLLQANNMFRQWSADITTLLKEGENELYILFASPVKEALPLWERLGYELPGGPKVMTRKAGYHYGWDWGPTLATSGIWRPVYLRGWDEIKINSLQIAQEKITEENARLTAVFEIDAGVSTDAVVSLRERKESKTLNQSSVKLVPGANRVSLSFEIKNPRLWWTNGLGEPYLYELEGMVETNAGMGDHLSQRIGLRTLEVVAEKDEMGESFYFKLNGQRLFIKGANTIPLDSFLPRVTDGRYRQLIGAAADAHMNMLRVWGGGIYENNILYDQCDEAGILVWQDFMFACAMYPGDTAFLENVRQEAVENVKRLRNHPCLALWCGNNEIDEAWHNWGWQSPFSELQRQKIWEDYQRLFHDLLPGVVRQNDPGRYYLPSSPKFGRGDPRSLAEGDSHYWGVWHDAEPFEMFREKTGRFLSEYGFQAFPSSETVRRFALPEDFNIESAVMKVHQKHPQGNQLIKTYMERDYHLPVDFEDFLYVSRVLQAEGMKIGIEALRRAKPFCMGSLYWQLNDCWPAVSWSSIDYYDCWKALHYFVEKAYREVLVSSVEENGRLTIYVVSDKSRPICGVLSLQLLNLAGSVLWKKKIPASVEANGCKVLFETGVAMFPGNLDKRDLVFRAVFRQGGDVLSTALHYFVKPKNLHLSEPGISVSFNGDADGYIIKLSCQSLAKNVYLRAPCGVFSDNYFDLVPGIPVTVHFVTDPCSAPPQRDLSVKLKIMSLIDTIK
jgi:beta-mannosidase